MADNRMTYQIDSNMKFPLVEIDLEAGDSIFLQQGSMVYHTPSVTLQTSLNGRGSGFGKLVGAIGRSMVSGESMFVTKAVAKDEHGKLALAPSMPGQVISLELGINQYCLNEGAFLAMDGAAHYVMKRQSIGKVFLGGQGGLFVMSTQGEGTLLANAFGSIKKISLLEDSLTIDNAHVVAWSQELDYNIHLENGLLQSFGTGEGIVNTFKGTGDIYVQSLNLEHFTTMLKPFLPSVSHT
ncbi:TIGR00266 family protein [Streptococcus dysgalactiae]|uniref:TIGR00266 family protein n=1 Tax=Streptococcus dysgalactiae TaxID=1334 RepID=UPI00128BB74E|nr:TIGR00266 family protein [Streptococcus dysgalactiae]GET69645.1 TIGR00266 family protein [Streptococcus dysgalactiae subsp. equisimilis]GET72384.1 TIGR00266 family protein [Streptococcus dysgalactiae subsp. equisimilis]